MSNISISGRFKELENFPYISFVSFIRGEIPQLVRGSPDFSRGFAAIYCEKKIEHRGDPVLPEEILSMFQKSGQNMVIHDGIIWEKYKVWNGIQIYRCMTDLTPKVKQTINDPELQRYLELLESHVGKEVRTTDILPRWAKDDFGHFLIPNLYYGRVSFKEGERQRGYKTSNVNLLGQPIPLGRTRASAFLPLVTLGTIIYEEIDNNYL